MIARVVVPKLSTNVDEATITKWFCKEGATIQKGSPLLEMTTEKAAFEVESPHTGQLRKILAREKSVLPTGYIIAFISTDNSPLPDVAALNAKLLDKHRQRSGQRTKEPAKPQPAISSPTAVSSSVRATPAARRLAREEGIDLAAIAAKLKVEVISETILREYLEQHKA